MDRKIFSPEIPVLSAKIKNFKSEIFEQLYYLVIYKVRMSGKTVSIWRANKMIL